MRLKPKKSLGQNFLNDKNILRKIVESLHLDHSSIVLEIGAGSGALTSLLAERAGYVHALEIDRALCLILKNNLAGFSNVKIINSDILKFGFSKYFSKTKKKVLVVGNIPYYISTPIIEYLIKFRKKISAAFLTVQKEFAERIVSGPGSRVYGSLSCYVQYYFEPKVIFKIKNNSFFPPPKVDSSFLALSVRRAPPVQVKDEELLFKVIRAGFGKRRKTLKNSLKNIIPPIKTEAALLAIKGDINVRAETLSLQDFAALAGL